MRKPFVPSHQISFQPFDGPLEITPVLLLMGDVWTQEEWDGLPRCQDWTHDHAWVIEGGEWWWARDGFCHTPQNRSGEIRIDLIPG